MPSILVHVNSEFVAQSVLPVVAELAEISGVSLLLLTAADRAAPDAPDCTVTPDVPPWLTSAAAGLRARNLSVTVAAVHPECVSGFLAAQPGDVALVVVPTDESAMHEPGVPDQLTRWFTEVTPRSVVVVPVDASRPAAPITLRRVLMALDGSAQAEEALRSGLPWMDPLGVELHLAQVVSEGAPREVLAALEAQAAHYLEVCALGLREDGWTVDTHVVSAADVASGIAEQAGETDVDLVILATRHRGGDFKPTTGPTVDSVLASATRPVMVVRPCPDPLAAPVRRALARQAVLRRRREAGPEGGHANSFPAAGAHLVQDNAGLRGDV